MVCLTVAAGRAVADNDLAIAPLQGGTSYDPRLMLGALPVDPRGDGFFQAIMACKRIAAVEMGAGVARL